MRINFVLPEANLSGGIRTIAVYASALHARGHRVTVLSTCRPPPPLGRRVRGLLRGRGWSRPSGPLPSHLDGSGVEHRRIAPYRPVVAGDLPDADVVVATWWLTAEWVAALPPAKGAKVLFVQGHDAETPGAPRARVEATWRLPMHRIVVSRWLLDLARDRCGVGDVTCVPNGVDLDHFTAPARGKQPAPTVGLIYTDDPLKGCEVALAAFEQARRAVPSLRLQVFASQAPTPGLPLPEGAAFRRDPAQRDIPGLYAACDAWLWPSRREGFGLPILEAMACRTPVIAAPAGAAPELLGGGGGVLLPAAEAGAMAAAIERVCGLPERAWRDLSTEAHAAAQGHGWPRSILLFEQALEGAVARGAGLR